MNTEAIRSLRDLFINLPDEQCDQSFFMTIRAPLRPVGERGPGCGVVACAAGWAVLTLAPTIQDQDMSDVLVEKTWAEEHDLSSLVEVDAASTPGYVYVDVAHVAAAALGLPHRIACRLFTDSPALLDGETDREWVVRQLTTLLETGELAAPDDIDYDDYDVWDSWESWDSEGDDYAEARP